jgi:hypothetical protein
MCGALAQSLICPVCFAREGQAVMHSSCPYGEERWQEAFEQLVGESPKQRPSRDDGDGGSAR